MPNRLRSLWGALTGTLWFVPATIVLTMAALALGMVELSSRVDAEVLARFPRVFGASADSSRAMLSAIAGAMITVAGLAFSLTMVAVTQASSQYTPRILRNFMRDRGNQVVLGVYVGVFAYSLLVVRTIRSGEEGRFLPSLAVVLGIALAMLSVGVLIYFVHHIASSLQASTIVQRVTHETLDAIDRLFPAGVGEEASSEEEALAITALDRERWRPVSARATGYVQALDGKGMLRLAESHDLLVRLVPAVGDFVVEGTPIAWAAPYGSPDARPAGAPTPARGTDAGDWGPEMARLFTVSTFRTVEQDAGFGMRQLVDIALKALSPGVNDTTTAVMCVDHLGAILVRLASRRVEAHVRAAGGTARVIAPGPTFESLLALAVDEIRQNARGNVGVLTRVLATLALVATCARSTSRRRLIAAHVALVWEAAEREVASPHDRAVLQSAAERALDAAMPVGVTAAARETPR
ncbi:MAG: DUF2254 domain-containing protein [Gemmatirosa sp.]